MSWMEASTLHNSERRESDIIKLFLVLRSSSGKLSVYLWVGITSSPPHQPFPSSSLRTPAPAVGE